MKTKSASNGFDLTKLKTNTHPRNDLAPALAAFGSLSVNTVGGVTTWLEMLKYVLRHA